MSDGQRGERPAGEYQGSGPSATGAVRAEQSGAQGGQTAKTPEQLQRDIERTREELGDTVEALAEKADVKAQARAAVDERKQKLRDKRDELKEKVSGGGGQSASGGEAAERARALAGQLAQRTSQQPLPYLGGPLAVGVVVGLVLRGRNR